jgi:CRP-like cAMP-binding protein
MRVAQSVPITNRLLTALPRAVYQRLLGNLEPVTLSFGKVLSEPGDSITHVYFPKNSLVSLLTVVDHHLALEVGMVGCEGMVGIGFALGISVTSVRAMAQGAGTAMRMKAAPFRKALRQSPSFQREVLLYAHALMAQIAQTDAFHFVEGCPARWLLMTRDRVESDQFRLTHEFLEHMLGVRRVGVTKAAHALKQRQLIDYSRGNIAIIDGGGLEDASCSCYQRVKDRQGKKRKAGDRIASSASA